MFGGNNKHRACLDNPDACGLHGFDSGNAAVFLFRAQKLVFALTITQDVLVLPEKPVSLAKSPNLACILRKDKNVRADS